MSVNVKKEKKLIPTYIPRKAMDLPMFFEKKPYQGASGRVYPLPFSDSISDEKTDVEYDVYTIENEYIMTQVLPDKGGKILRGYDKIGNYDFIYYNEVIKPALVGLAGPWISGGIEFNYPQHHRPTTYMPLETVIEESETGEKTVWTGEVEPFNRLKGMVGIAVDEGRSYIKAKVKVYNRTNQPQVFMWWANLAVPVNETYKTIFPPDVEWVNDHDRRCVMSWPIAKGVYHTARPFDYGEGTDISMYDAVKVPSSFLVSQGQSDMDFVAGYDGGKQMGIVTVADHNISPGKKMWHWGKGDFGDMWCSNLTDKNGPYIELMTGVYTDNQPDFTWIAPYESRVFEQYWYPIRDIGDVKNATVNAALNAEKRNDNLFFGFNVTGKFEKAKVSVTNKGAVVFEDICDMTPASAYIKEIPMAEMKLEDITVSLTSNAGETLVEYTTYVRGRKQPITPRKPVLRPCEIETVEELYINGLHLEQYKQHNYDARDYYLEGIKRDNNDIRCNTGMARISFKNGQFEDCLYYAQNAIKRATSRNMHPSDTEALYFKGLALKAMGKLKEAYDALAMATWDYGFISAANHEMALLDCLNHNFDEAIEKLDTSLKYNTDHTKASNLKAVILRKLGKSTDAQDILKKVRAYDPLDMYSAVEMLNFGGSPKDLNEIFGKKPENYLDVAYDYIAAGFYHEAINVLEMSQHEYPLYDYVKAYCLHKLGSDGAALQTLYSAEARDTGYCFPARLDDIPVLEYAISANPNGANSCYYLGCLYYDRFAYEKSVILWEKAAKLNPKHTKVFRNLALAYFDKKEDFLSAKACMEIALVNKPDDSRLLLEYQQILKNMNCSPRVRLNIYEKHNDLMLMRDDCVLDKITLKCMVEEYKEAIEIAKSRHFHIYEGGEGKLTKLHAWMHVLYGNELRRQGKTAEAEKAYKDGINMPASYGEAKTFFNQEAHIYYYLGELTGNTSYYEEASVYKAAVSELSLFRAMALRKLHNFRDALNVLKEMIDAADNLIKNCDLRTYYGVGSPSPMPCESDIVKMNLTNGYILKAYALLGLGKFNLADSYIKKAEEIDTYDFRIIAYHKISSDISSL